MRLFHQSVILASLLACLALVLHPTPAGAATGPGGGGGGSGGLTNGYSFKAGFTTANTTNVFLVSAISNLMAAGVTDYATNRNLLPSLFTNVVYVNATGATAIINGRLLTNAFVNAPAYCKIVVGPGTYITPTNTVPSTAFSKDNRWIEFSEGARWGSGIADGTGEGSFMFDDTALKVTNVSVTGFGEFYQTNVSSSILWLENGSKVYFEHKDLVQTNGDSAFSMTGANELIWRTKGKASCFSYDLLYFNLASGSKVDAKFAQAETLGDLAELGNDAANWGDVVIEIGKSRVLESPNGGAQYSIAQIGGRAIFRPGIVTVDRTNASFYATGNTTNGLIEGATILMPSYGRHPVIKDASGGSGAPFSGNTILWLKNCTVYSAPNVNALHLTNGAAAETILENCTFYLGANATNFATGHTPSKLRIINVAMSPYQAVGANVTLLGTNVVMGFNVRGTLDAAGAATFANSVTVSGGNLTVRDNDIDNNQSIFTDSMFVTNIFYMPMGASPAPDGFGSIVADNNLWAASRGAILTYDGTANVALVGVLTSDTPSNGQVPTWNTGGTITWETPSGGGSLITNGSQFGASTTLTIKQKAVVTNLVVRSTEADGIAITFTNQAGTNNIPFQMAFQHSDANASFPTNGGNQVFRIGGNIDANGSLLNPTNGALFDSWELNYEPSIGETWVERHMTSLTTNTTIPEQRFLTYYNVTKAPTRPRQGFSTVAFQSDEFWIQDRAGNQVLKVSPGTANTGVTNGYLFTYPSNVIHQYNNHSFPLQMKDTGGTYRYGTFLSSAGVWVHGLQAITNEFQSKIQFNTDNTYDIGGSTNALRPRNIYAGTAIYTPQLNVIGSTSPGELQLNGTNGNAAVFRAANSNSFNLTNGVGWLHKAYASVVVLDCNHANKFMFTNRAASANTTLVLTNLAQGQEVTITMLGESAANDRTVTVVPQLGYLVSDLDAFGVAVALNKVFTLTNNNGVEISALAKWGNWDKLLRRSNPPI